MTQSRAGSSSCSRSHPRPGIPHNSSPWYVRVQCRPGPAAHRCRMQRAVQKRGLQRNGCTGRPGGGGSTSGWRRRTPRSAAIWTRSRRLDQGWVGLPRVAETRSENSVDPRSNNVGVVVEDSQSIDPGLAADQTEVLRRNGLKDCTITQPFIGSSPSVATKQVWSRVRSISSRPRRARRKPIMTRMPRPPLVAGRVA